VTKQQVEKAGLAVLLAAAALYIYANWLWQPQVARVYEQAQELRRQQEHLRLLNSYAANAGLLAQETSQAEAALAKLQKQVPATLNKGNLLVNIYTLAKRHGVQAQNLTFEELQQKGNVREMGMALVLTGAAEDVLATIKDLQYGDTLHLAVQSVTLGADKNGVKADLKLLALAAAGSTAVVPETPGYMNSPFGVDSVAKLFRQ